MKRIVSVWLPRLATDRLCRRCAEWRDEPLATAGADGRRLLLAVNRAARLAGLRAGMTVADARAVAPGLRLAPTDPAGDRALLDHLAEGCIAYTPWTAVDDGPDSGEGGGLWLDISGCAHLWGGEEALLAELLGRLGRLGFAARAAAADTPGAAWAWARLGDAGHPVLAPGGQQKALAGLPVTALRLPPEIITGLVRLGLKNVGDLYPLPRAALAERFGRIVALRLDQALGRQDEPVSPRRPVEEPRVQLAFAEAIAGREDLAAAVRHLLERLTGLLECRRLGVRRLELAAFRLDASARRLTIGTSRPSRDPGHLFRLLAEPLAGLDAGFGVEMLLLAATETGSLEAAQASLAPAAEGAEGGEEFTRLLDALGNRLGCDRVLRFAPRQSHLPERAVRCLGPAAFFPTGEGWPAARRPLRLLLRPEAVEAVAPLPDGPPLLFRWRRHSYRIRRAEGPERLAAEWWRQNAPDRDYYCVEDEAGRRFWLFRQGFYGEGEGPRWFLHGVFP